eukprot:CAMPEP_0198316738 /NCGR_PEP_ID=MMETSP1450-20131203/6510_1 /TAXON_ID=753684 ORGANISM="Madagascaria erythrocladiodes, Strain CCMP3234" /NCGR_SAMPLE_ID=MMETSP1450 /ASSEMBLY_ACC=CAM_ASM_001115 /LENGTH=280 /DNA_ID=CAMNT_0044019905 /DNA_START=39 /DNA_END=882 /DNA_ORIENTATION=-
MLSVLAVAVAVAVVATTATAVVRAQQQWADDVHRESFVGEMHAFEATGEALPSGEMLFVNRSLTLSTGRAVEQVWAVGHPDGGDGDVAHHTLTGTFDAATGRLTLASADGSVKMQGHLHFDDEHHGGGAAFIGLGHITDASGGGGGGGGETTTMTTQAAGRERADGDGGASFGSVDAVAVNGVPHWTLVGRFHSVSAAAFDALVRVLGKRVGGGSNTTKAAGTTTTTTTRPAYARVPIVLDAHSGAATMTWRVADCCGGGASHSNGRGTHVEQLLRARRD